MKVTTNPREPNWSGRGVRAWLDGVEITNDCYESDDVEGYAMLYRRDDAGRIAVPIERVRREGRVVLEITGPPSVVRYRTPETSTVV